MVSGVKVGEYWLYTFWAVECIGMSGIVWYTPALLLTGHKHKHEKHENIKMNIKRITEFNHFLILGSILPTLYIFSLPYLSSLEFASTPPDGMISISHYLDTA